ncbi:hypothetical protein HYW18_03670 [Candidatus Uhrbacteria bacterium]|nr:hypothetical protein [Candidatus Uhrbacteria bacterium]
MSHTPNYDVQIKAILDAAQPGERVCPVSGERWMMTEEELIWMRKFQVPPSDISPTIRRKLLFGFNSGVTIWWNTDAVTKKLIVSYIHPDNPIPVVEDSLWHAQDWSDRGARGLDIAQPFFPQLRQVLHAVPFQATRTFGTPVNSMGVGIISAEDSFMVFGGVKNTRRSAYGFMCKELEDCEDTFIGTSSQESFSLNRSTKMYRCRVAMQCQECVSCDFLFDSRNCESCFLGSNLRNRKYVFANEQLSKETYEQKMKEVDLTSWKVFQSWMQRYLEMLRTEAVWPENFNVGCEASSGEYLMKCVRCTDGFGLSFATDMYACQLCHSVVQGNAYTSGIDGTSDSYMAVGVINGSRVLFSTACMRCQNIEYCLNCSDCENCFGCVGLKNKKFHILNKAYAEEEYWNKLDELKCAMLDRDEYGNFFPGDFSPSGIQWGGELHAPLTDEEVVRLGGIVFDAKRGAVISLSQSAVYGESMDPELLPDGLEACALFAGRPIMDPELERPFTVRKEDVAFYTHMRLPFPRRHFMTRIRALARLGNTFMAEQGLCQKCSKEVVIHKNIAFPKRKIYCTACYLAYLEQVG